MKANTLFRNPSITVIDYRCDAGPQDAPYFEEHTATSMSYVRRGTFGYRYRGAAFDLAPGAMLFGCRGDEFMCTHEHHGCGDECLSFHFAPGAVESIGGDPRLWRTGYVPPLPELSVFGELAQAAAEGASEVGLDEIGLLLAARFCELAAGRRRGALRSRVRRSTSCDRSCAVDRRALA